MSAPKPSIFDLTRQSAPRMNIVSLLGAGYELRMDVRVPDGVYLVLDYERDGHCRIYTSAGDPHGLMTTEDWNALPLAPGNFHMLRNESEQQRVREAAENFIQEHCAFSGFNPGAQLVLRAQLLELFACKLKAGYLDYAIDIISGDAEVTSYPLPQGIRTRKSVAKWCRTRSAKIIGRGPTWGTI